jgi:hypothetical protein
MGRCFEADSFAIFQGSFFIRHRQTHFLPQGQTTNGKWQMENQT